MGGGVWARGSLNCSSNKHHKESGKMNEIVEE